MPELTNDDEEKCCKCYTILEEEEVKHGQVPMALRGEASPRFTLAQLVGKLCDSCCEEYATECYHCDRQAWFHSAIAYGDEMICSDCYQNDYTTCNGCDDILLCGDTDDDGNCNNCHVDSSSVPELNGSQPCVRDHNLNIRNVRFNDLRVALPVAYEVESEFSDSVETDTLRRKLDALHSSLGIGYCYDGSLANGVEVQIPPARELVSDAAVKKVTAMLKKEGCEIKNSCGLHIHIATGHLKPKMLHRLFLSWYALEPLAFALVPSSRRSNSYCRSWRDVLEVSVKSLMQMSDRTTELYLYHDAYTIRSVLRDGVEDNKPRLLAIEQQANCSQPKRLERQAKRNKGGADRYFAANFHSVGYLGSLEVRLHSGTLDADKMLHWSRFCRAICNFSRVEDSVWKLNKEALPEIERLAVSVRACDDKAFDSLANLFRTLNLPDDSVAFLTARYKELNPSVTAQRSNNVVVGQAIGWCEIVSAPLPERQTIELPTCDDEECNTCPVTF